ncbi:hypothetical protein GCM10020358_50250 [Amorphoplanes nipponensis]|uniref:Uncharacterized protein n=1 Tax=Actinoplanes nipponensis TaxID=135950 RepID=A0A919JIL0_9ACTN|nr:hypothetical protein [Actinoplanes nipponensis]GIE47469.1 hypothetical protein Ani05nite_10030 [Actinoplanes nipponensis]
MGQSWRFVVAWLTAAVAAVTVSWLGVRIGIAPAITDEAPVAIDVNRRYTEVRFGLADVTPAPAPSRPAPSRTSARPTRTPSTPATRRPAPSRPATATPSPSPSPSPPDRRPRYRVNAEGGDVIVAYSPTRVDVIDTDPVPGYVASATRRSNTLVVVRLAGPSHASVVTVYWNAGPGAQIVEEFGG